MKARVGQSRTKSHTCIGPERVYARVKYLSAAACVAYRKALPHPHIYKQTFICFSDLHTLVVEDAGDCVVDAADYRKNTAHKPSKAQTCIE